MTIVEWMAAITAIAVVIKILVILVKPKAWMGVVKPIYANSVVLMIVGLILAGGSLYYLTQAGMSIVDMFAVLFFLSMLMMVSVAAYNKELMALGQKMLKNRSVLRKGWLSLIIWLFLAIWALKELFM
jgi:hypothetical protein